LLLRKDFYDNNKSKVIRSMFPQELADLFDTIVKGHNKYDRDLTVLEVRELYSVDNPTATRARKEIIYDILDDIDSLPHIGEDVANDVVRSIWQQEVGRRIADLSLAIMEGSTEKLQEIKSIVEKSEDGFVPDDETEPVPTDLDTLLDYVQTEDCWQFNIPSLSKLVRGGKGGEFMIAFARPEIGKTAFYVSLAASPNGFCCQGADVHIITNEEPARRTMLRAASAYTGYTQDELFMKKGEAKKVFSEIAPNLTMIDNVDASIEWLNVYCETKKPDILIIDQLDKINVMGSFARTDEKLRAIYTKFREVCKRHNLFGIGISQASADAESKTNVTYAMMENSKTGKAAEADLIVGIGKSDITDNKDERRYLTISKNKLTGFHGNIVCNLDIARSRFTA
jgi:replicative DNA helicase|tara:strand:+ start:94 stop:1284 length:1191 start_codon:yes stop_codon:yes gene_type:complete